MAETDRCSRCGAPLARSGTEGASCLRCLLALGLADGFGAAEAAAASGGTPEHVGPYRILDTLGAGERSVVYLAERQQRVALKVVSSDPGGPDVLARFETLRPALDRVSHPGLARVLEAGRTEDGRTWFALERVPGVPITEHCDRERLTVSRRLELFIEVCEAVEHAHAQGVAHGGLKPSNVVVTVDDEVPRSRILDLGVDHALDTRLTAESLYTARGLLAGSPCYVPPERTGPASENPVPTSEPLSDVYSLGVLLYELLTGAPPFDPRRLRQAGWAEMVRVIREDPPPRPSARVAGFDRIRAAEVAARRRTEPAPLVDALRPDLDRVVLAALAKEPSRRYPSVHDVALDLRRALRGEPVSARPRGFAGLLARAAERVFAPWRG